MAASWPSAGFLTSFLNNLNLNGNFKIITNDTDDPTIVAKDAPQNSFYLREGTTDCYLKTDNGLSTNWEKFGSFQDMLAYFGNIQSDPTGFPDDAESQTTLSLNNGTREFTITPTGANFTFYEKGVLYTKSAPDTVVIPNIEGNHFVYYVNGVLTTTNVFTSDIITKYAYVSAVRWDATNAKFIYRGNERHRHKMPGVVHSYLHLTFGSQYRSGLSIGNIIANASGALDTHAQYSITAGRFDDEDIPFNLPAVNVGDLTMPVWYLEGATPVWRRADPTAVPLRTAGTGRMAYNQFTGGAWQQTEIVNNNYALMHVFKTNDEFYPTHVIQGQAEYATLPAARAGAITELNNLVLSGLPEEEFIPIGTIIYQTSNTYVNSVKSRIRTTDTGDSYIDWRQQGLSPASPATDHGALTGLADDDHPQYVRNHVVSTLTGVNNFTGSETRNSFYLLNDAAGAVTINLPAFASLNNGYELTFILLDGTFGATIDANLAETINGRPSIILKNRNQRVTIVKTATDWKVKTSNKENNFNATTAPTVNDDENDDYQIGSLWVDTLLDVAYICAESFAGAASWLKISPIKNNFTALVDPTVNDDSGDNYEAGSIWYNTVLGRMYILTNATLGAAVWVICSQNKVNITNVAPTANDDAGDGYQTGSIWYNTLTDYMYICTSSNLGAAVWTVLVTPASTHTLTNKNLDAATTNFTTATSRQIGFSQAGQTDSTKLIISTPITVNRTLTMPDATDTLVGKATADILTNKKFAGGTATATNKHLLSRESTANLTALAREEGSIYYDETLNQPVFDDGTTLRPLQWDAVGRGLNFVNNPSMIINQRGIAGAAAITTGAYGLDQWKNDLSGLTANLERIVINQPSLPYFTASARLTATSTATGYFAHYQIPESGSQFAGKTVTFSAYVKSNSSNAKLVIFPTGQPAVGSTAHTGGGGWERLSVTITPTNGINQFYIGNMSATSPYTVSTTAGAYVEITGVQLEMGSTATPFIPRRADDELAICLRHFWRITAGAWTAHCIAAGTMEFWVPFTVNMRQAPVITTTANSITYYFGGTGTFTPSIALGYAFGVMLSGTVGGSVKDSTAQRCQVSGGATIDLSAEL